MLGPGNDSGSSALIDDQYDEIIGAIAGEHMESMVLLAVRADDGRSGIMPWQYRPVNVKTARLSVNPDPRLRLVTLMGAVRGATRKAEANGLECA